MDITITPAARKQLDAMPKAYAKRIEAAIRQIAEAHPQRLAFATEMAGRPGVWRARKGDYRAIYRFTAEGLEVVTIGHRKEIYR